VDLAHVQGKFHGRKFKAEAYCQSFELSDLLPKAEMG
jgi:hypothetical protein